MLDVETNPNSMPPTPELDKRSKVLEQSQPIGEFVDWLRGTGRMIARWGEDEDGEDILYLTGESIEKLLAEYFEIDLDKIEEERRTILEHLRRRDEPAETAVAL